MNFLVIYVVLALIIGAVLIWRRWDEWKAYDRRTKLGILKGPALVFVVLAIAVALSGCQGVSVFAGLDATKNISPQCEEGGPSDRVTSNMGFRAHHYDDGKLSIHSKYTHHSCAFSPDDKSYDGLGFELERRLW